MKRGMLLFLAILLAAVTVKIPVLKGAQPDSENSFEVWIVDQSNTRDENGNGTVTDAVDSGGTVYIYDGETLNGESAANASPAVIDLGAGARNLSIAQTGTAPIRPHMLFFNEGNTHVVISFVATGHVLFFDAATRAPVAAVDVGTQAHAAVPSLDDNYVIVADQNGKKLHRILTDYDTNTFTYDAAGTLELAVGLTPNGLPREDAVLRPDNAPICPDFDDTGQFAFVTLRGGGLFVVDTFATPMAIVAEYDRATVHPNGCGGLETNGKMYVDAGGGTPANPLESDLYTFPLNGYSTTPNPPNTPAPNVVFSRDSLGFVDSHGIVLTKHDRYLWVADRAANRIVVVDTESDTVVNEINLVGDVSSDPTPDLMEISPSGNRVFIAFRGPIPLTGNAPSVNNAVGATPGLGIVRVEEGGRNGVLQAIAPISHVVNGVERADPHGIALRVK